MFVLSPNNVQFNTLFNHLSYKVSHIYEMFSNAEIMNWLKYLIHNDVVTSNFEMFAKKIGSKVQPNEAGINQIVF